MNLFTVALGLLCASHVAAWTDEPSASRWQTRLKASISSQRLETSAGISPPSKNNAGPTKDSVVLAPISSTTESQPSFGPARAIFCSRSLDLQAIDVIGYDMDVSPAHP